MDVASNAHALSDFVARSLVQPWAGSRRHVVTMSSGNDRGQGGAMCPSNSNSLVSSSVTRSKVGPAAAPVLGSPSVQHKSVASLSVDNRHRAPDVPTFERPLRIAVDVDEVLGSFLATLNVFCEERYGVSHDVDEFFAYDFKQIWKCSQEEANHRVHAFFESTHFNDGLPTIPGAYETLKRLSSVAELVIVTSRQHVIRQPTLDWLNQHFPDLFSEVHFGNHYALSGQARPKSEMCKSIGAQILIDDNPKYAIECAEHGIHVLLFDWKLTYPWSKTPDGPSHPLITRVHDWQAVEAAVHLFKEKSSKV